MIIITQAAYTAIGWGKPEIDKGNVFTKQISVILYSPIKKRRCNMSQSSGTSLQPNVAGLLCYVFGWVSGLVFFLIEKNDDFVRFHAMQSIIVFGTLAVFSVIFGILMLVPFLGAILFAILWIGVLILWILLMVKAYQGEKFKLPVIGDLAEKWSQ
jgi:uncharacterized membrane protein